MRWQKRNAWKIGIAITGTLLLLLVMEWISVSVAGANTGTLGQDQLGIVTVQVTPTEDATVTALNKEKLAQEVLQLKSQNEPDFFGRLQANATLLSALLVVIGGLIGLSRWFVDRQSEREKRAEERFQSVVTGLGDEKEEAKIGAAILLRTFLRPGYEQFYSQAFELAVAYLRFSEIGKEPERLTSLRQALITVFKESFRARSVTIFREIIKKNKWRSLPFRLLPNLNIGIFALSFDSLWSILSRLGLSAAIRQLDAEGIHLDNANLAGADLEYLWIPGAYLRKADLRQANLQRANLSEADLREANLRGANLSGADLRGADLRGADLREVNLENTLSVRETDLREVKGLTKEQLEACKTNGAIINEGPTASSSQSIASLPSPSQSDNVQTPSILPAQGNAPTADVNESSAPSSTNS